MNFKGKTIVVTGAGSGMGRELALQLIARGANVAAVDLNPHSLHGTATFAGFSEALATFTANITDVEAMKALPAQVVERFGAVDGLINNAGIVQPFKRVADLTEGEIDRVLDVNLRGTIRVTRAFLPHLLQRPEAAILNVASMGGFVPVPGQTIYGAAKAGVKLFTEGLHSELAGTGVTVTAAYPGAVATNIMQNSGQGALLESMDASVPQPPQLSAEAAAHQMLSAMQRGAYSAYVGNDSRLMHLLTRLVPQRAAGLVAGQTKALLDREVSG